MLFSFRAYAHRSLSALGVLALTHSALAGPSGDSAAAQALFEQGRSLLATGHAAEACPKLEESQRLDPGSGTLLNLARCYEQTHRLASAWSKYLEAAAAAKASDNSERESEARQQAARLRPRLANLTIVVPSEVSAVPGLQITRDGEPVGSPQWGLPIPADEGEHTVVAKAPGFLPWQGVVSLRREGSTTTLNVRAMEPEPAIAPTPTAAGPMSATQVPTTSARAESHGGTQRALSAVIGVAGLVGLGVGAGFGLKSKAAHDEAAKYCRAGSCDDPRGVSATHDAYDAGKVATIATIAGAAGVVAGLTLWLTAPSSREESAPQVGLGLGTLQLKGAF